MNSIPEGLGAQKCPLLFCLWTPKWPPLRHIKNLLWNPTKKRLVENEWGIIEPNNRIKLKKERVQ